MRRSLVFGLRARNIDVLTAAEAGMVNRPDEQHLTVAASSARVLLSYNTGDYCALHERWVNEGRIHSGIVVATQQRFGTGEELRRIARLIGSRSAEQMENHIEFLSRWA